MTKGNPRVGQRRHQIASLKIGRIIHCHPSPEFDVCNLLNPTPGSRSFANNRSRFFSDANTYLAAWSGGVIAP